MPFSNFRASCGAVVLFAGVIGAGWASASQLTPIQNAPAPANDPISFVPFPTAGDAYNSATNGSGTIAAGGQTAFQWTTGDYVLSSVFKLPTTSVTDLSADWSYINNLGGGGSETWYVYVNGVAVAQATLVDTNFSGDTLTITGTVDFADIAPVSGGYQVELVLQNTVPDGEGSVAWLDGGTTGLSYSVPERSTWAMMLVGFAGLGLAGYSRSRKARLAPAA